MTDTPNKELENQQEKQVQLEGGTYEIIKGRLSKHGKELRSRLAGLNERRKEVFGSIEMQLINNQHINTTNNCIARDIISFDKLCIFGYNVRMGLRDINLNDVFSIYTFDDEHNFKEVSIDFISANNAKFVADFKSLYRYSNDVYFLKFAKDTIDPFFYMIFQEGTSTRTFKWEIRDGEIFYDTSPGTKEYKYPKQFEFEWLPVKREMFRQGEHPHISILDKVFVETVGGDLTIKVEDNTATGKGIYEEDVKYKQKLDDATVFYADLGNLIALKIKPYQEEYRYFIFNIKLQTVQRVDALENSGILLPGDQGLIFSNGFYLQTGDFKMFDKTGGGDNIFEYHIPSPNGEDHLFVFYNPHKGSYLLLSYNIIEQKVETPIFCHGYTLFPDGELCYFRSEENKSHHHVIQIWSTPYLKGNILPSQHTESMLYKIGNKDIVRAMAECQELLNLLGKDETYGDLYYDLTQRSNVILDSYYWLQNKEAFDINVPLKEIHQSAKSAIDEFEKVQSIQKATKEQIKQTSEKAQELFKRIRQSSFNKIDVFVQFLAEMRIVRGEVISLKELRYTNLPSIEELEAKATEINETLSQNCVNFLLKDDALQPYLDRVAEAQKEIETIESARQGKRLEERIDAIGKELELLIEIVSNLKIDDATQTTRIIDSITAIFSTLNQTKAAVKRRLRDLTGAEAVAEFAAQAKLLDQGLINYLDIADTVAKCDEYYTKMMIQLEELESKFAEFDEFILKITEKREEISNAFEMRRLSIVEANNKRTATLQAAAERILNGVRNRVRNFKEVSEINGFFAADLMIEKVRDTITKLNDLGDTNKAGDINTQLKTIKEESIRQLRDKKDLFTGAGDGIKFGKHVFSVNNQKLDLTMVPRDGEMYYHLTGTGFFEQVEDETFRNTKIVWNQSLISENTEVYRAEYLAYLCFEQIQKDSADIRSDEVLEYVQKFSANRYQEGYSKGIHDEDAAKLLDALLYLNKHVDLLSYSAQTRAIASMFWNKFLGEEEKTTFNKQLKSAGIILRVFPQSKEFEFLLQNLTESLRSFIQETQLFEEHQAVTAAKYLFEEMARHDYFIISGEAHHLKQDFKKFLENNAALKAFEESLKSLDDNGIEQFELARKWLSAFVAQQENQLYVNYIDEVASLLVLNSYNESQVIDVKMQMNIEGLHGTHNAVGKGGVYDFDFNRFMRKVEDYTRVFVPAYHQFTEMKKTLVEQFRMKLRLDEFQPRVLSSFVRNKLIDALYLPIFGDNLAKQIGTVGDNTRTDRMGMLLLISPPGYGKTTLMEYIANRLGLIFMKINGPAIGHHVTSLDPSEANNAAAKKELEKLNLALEMGDNIMLYLDDIQHCNPEFLQKFISLTDAQRKIEGVYKGITKTYDLRGKRVSVVMAGNPYTETGDKFQIPDMLANRADIYNLGDIIGDTKEVFEMSYIENSLTSNGILQKLSSKSSKDIYAIMKYAETGSREGIEFEANHSPQEIEEYVKIMKHMLRVRDAILKVNLEYIRSAAMEDSFRTEPSFKLQGSYRNMNKLAEKIVPIMNDKELETMLIAHYEGESQTLTSGAESNMLKFKEMIGALTEEDTQRWAMIKESFNKDKMLKGSEDNPMVQMVAQLAGFADHLKDIRNTIKDGIEKGVSTQSSKRSGGARFKKS